VNTSKSAAARRLPLAGADENALADTPASTAIFPDTTVDPVQSTTWVLSASDNPIVFGTGTRIDTTGSPGKAAVSGASGAQYVVTNEGTLLGGGDGIYLPGGGVITNTGKITGNSVGVTLSDFMSPSVAGTLINSGAIASVYANGNGVQLLYGGTIRNLAGGTISGGGYAIFLHAGGNITNARGATITGKAGIFGLGGPTKVINDGHITGTNGKAVEAGTVVNYAQGVISGSTQAIYGAVQAVNSGMIIGGVSATHVVNSGTIVGGVSAGGSNASIVNRSGATISSGVGVGSPSGSVANAGTIGGAAGATGVAFSSSGELTNTGTISGAQTGARFLQAGGTVINSGEISGQSFAGLQLNGTGVLRNQASGVIAGNAEGVNLVNISDATITNAGTISGYVAFEFDQYQLINNPAIRITNASTGLITGHIGINFQAAATLTNAGQIDGDIIGVNLSGGELVNQAGGVISGGDYAVGGGGSIVNAGTIESTGGIALYVGATGALLNKAGAHISGDIGIQLGGGDITNAGSIVGVGVDEFGVSMSAAGNLSNKSGGYIGATGAGGEAVAATARASVTNAGRINGAVGVDLMAGGTVSNARKGVIAGVLDGVKLEGDAGTVTNSGTITGGTDSVLFAGGGANKLILQAGSNLVGAPVGSTASGATNALILRGTGASASWFQNFTTLNKQWVGTWTLSGQSAIASTQVSAGVLTVTNYLRSNFDVLSGATLQVGDASHGGEIVANGAFANSGVLRVVTGLADIVGAVSGAGSAVVAGGTLEFDSTFAENVAFTGSAGVLQLAKSQTYTGAISGFSLTGATSLDLRDIAFTSGTIKASFVENGAKTSGALTVTDGTHTSHITLAGDFTGESFTAGSDSHGGTSIVAKVASAASLGVSANTVVNPVQNSTYDLKSTNNPITFGATTKIDATGTPGANAVTGAAASRYLVVNQGSLSASGYGIQLLGSGTVTNSGHISSQTRGGVSIRGSGAVANTGTIVGGVGLGGGGKITNGARAVISGGVGIGGAAGTVVNAGAIENAAGGDGADLNLGTLTNLTAGYIGGQNGVASAGYEASLKVVNAGVIKGASNGVTLAGGSVTNKAGGTITGATGVNVVYGDSVANSGKISGLGFGIDFLPNGTISNFAGGLITGDTAVDIDTSSTLNNAGSIEGSDGFGVAAGSIDRIHNQKTGLISGDIGVNLDSDSTLTNAGTITGVSSYGVELKNDGAVVNRAGGKIIGATYGLAFYHASGTLTNAGSIVGTSQAGILFNGGDGALINQASGAISGKTGADFSGGPLTNAGHITGTSGDGVKLLKGGVIDNEAGGVIAGHTDGVEVDGFVGKITNAGTLSGVDSVDFTGAGVNSLTLQTGSLLIGVPIGSTASGATNALILQGTGAAANWFQNFTTLDKQGAGTWTLSGTSAIGLGQVSAGTLIVTGFLRSTFNILAGATLQVGDASRGGEIIANGGFTNGGLIRIRAGLADMTGAVSGAGSAVIAGGTLEFDSTFTQNVAFTRKTGVLQLGKSQSYTGSISGLSLTGSSSLDLRDIGFTSGTTKATYVDNGSHTGGVLTVTDGTHTAKIKLVGDYSASTFTTSSDSHGGTTVVDPQAKAATVLSFIAAMAGFGAGPGGHVTATADPGRSPQPLLAVTHPNG